MGASPTTLQAIQAMFDASGTLSADAAATKGMWTFEVPEEYTGVSPLIALVQEEEVPDFNTENSSVMLLGKFTFHVFAVNDLKLAESLGADIMGVYDPNSTTNNGFPPLPLDATKYSSSWIARTNYHVRLADFRDPSGLPVYEVILPYSTEATKLT